MSRIILNTESSVIQTIDMPWFTPGHIRVNLKRDDLIHPFVSGNKWRKLKYNLLEAEKLGHTNLETFGGAYSNHLLAVACAGAMFGFSTRAHVRGEEPRIKSHVLGLCSYFGMKLNYVSRSEYRNDKNNLQSKDAYIIPEGGSNKLAVRGVAELFRELNNTYDFIYTAAGTGGTTAGLLSGADELKLDTRIRSISALKGGEFLAEDIKGLGAGIERLDLVTDMHHGGYADYSPELISFMKRFTAETGILLDPVYTGKMMYALWNDIQKEKIRAGSEVLAIHTGGLTGLLSDKFLTALS